MTPRAIHTIATALLVPALLLVAAACANDSDDEPAAADTPASEEPAAEADPQPDPEADPEPDPEADPEPDPEADPEPQGRPGVVEPPPEGAEQVNVTLDEWVVLLERDSVPAGQVYFLADNDGVEAHELVVIRSDQEPDDLPVEDGRVPEDEVDFVGEIEAFRGGSRASGVFDLTAGSYILLCNIVEVEENGEIESHVEQGMVTTFSVE